MAIKNNIHIYILGKSEQTGHKHVFADHILVYRGEENIFCAALLKHAGQKGSMEQYSARHEAV